MGRERPYPYKDRQGATDNYQHKDAAGPADAYAQTVTVNCPAGRFLSHADVGAGNALQGR